MIAHTPGTLNLYRALTPRWAFAPLSGAGAAKVGGRFNRPGIEALYLSLDAATAIAEYRQTAPRLPPLTLCEYRATAPPLVDLRCLDEGRWDAIWQDWASDWRNSLFEHHIEPSTWTMGDMALDAGYCGILFPSLAHPGGTNLVLYLDSLQAAGGSITINDPDHRLPKDDSSWRP